MSDLTPFVDIDNRKLSDESGGTFSYPQTVLGDRLNLALGALRRTDDGIRTVDLKLRTIRAAIGPIQAPPLTGSCSLRYGLTPTDPETEATLSTASTAEAVKTLLTGVHDDWTPEEVVLAEPGCWLVRFEEQEGDAPLRVGAINTFAPRSFCRVRSFTVNGVFWTEIRLIQAPFAFATTFTRVLPPEPTIERVRPGGSSSGSDDIVVNELQSLTMPATFRGTFDLAFGGRRTNLLGTQDDADSIAVALNAMYADKQTRFAITNPEDNKAYIEFIGALGDASQELIVITVRTFPAGVPTVVINLNTAEMAAALRVGARLDATTFLLSTNLEIELEYVGDDEDPNDEEIESRFLTCQLPIKIAREIIYAELATVPAIDWLRPPARRDYIPFDVDSVITGQQHYTAVIGDGTTIEFEVDHGLDTDDIASIAVRENASGGRILAATEYSVVIEDANTIIINFAIAPSSNALAIVITSAGPVSAFQNHTHSIGQITGLQAFLDELTDRVEVLEDLGPGLTRPVVVDPSAAQAEIVIDDIEEIFPAKKGAEVDAKAAQKNLDLLPRPLVLLPAVHDASTDALSLPLGDPAASAGSVFENQSGEDVIIPAGYGQRSYTLPNNGFAASDGRLWYPVSRSGSTSSYFPTQFERELFLISLSAEAWLPGGRLEIQFDVLLQMLVADTRGVYTLVIETGTAPADTTPGTPDPKNLSNITWDATPLLAQRIVVTSTMLKHRFGARIKRSSLNVITADQLKYNAWTTADAAPGGTSFVIRARLVRWDTENNVQNARGFIYRKLEKASAQIS